jgi:hypothetical protein
VNIDQKKKILSAVAKVFPSAEIAYPNREEVVAMTHEGEDYFYRTSKFSHFPTDEADEILDRVADEIVRSFCRAIIG